MAVVSVVVPVYKVEAFIHRCVDSILGQTFTDFELILVDDGSPDNCGRICDEYAEKDSRIHVIHQTNGGLSAARNAGIDWVFANSDSEWITFVDSDDWIHADFLQYMLRIAEKNATPVAVCKAVKRKDYCEDNVIDACYTLRLSSQEAYSQYYYQCMTAWGKIYKTYLWKDIRFPVGKLHEDAYITHYLIFGASRVMVTNAGLYYYYYNSDSITRTKWSVKRLDELEGHEVRRKFCADNGYTTCYISEIEAIVDVLVKQIEQISDCAEQLPDHKCHLSNLRKKLREMLREARGFKRCLFDEEYWGVYTLAYPSRICRIAVWIWLQLNLERYRSV